MLCKGILKLKCVPFLQGLWLSSIHNRLQMKRQHMVKPVRNMWWILKGQSSNTGLQICKLGLWRRWMSQQRCAKVRRVAINWWSMWVPRGRECVFNVHHPSVWQIMVASAEVHLATCCHSPFPCKLRKCVQYNWHSSTRTLLLTKEHWIHSVFMSFIAPAAGLSSRYPAVTMNAVGFYLIIMQL